MADELHRRGLLREVQGEARVHRRDQGERIRPPHGPGHLPGLRHQGQPDPRQGLSTPTLQPDGAVVIDDRSVRGVSDPERRASTDDPGDGRCAPQPSAPTLDPHDRARARRGAAPTTAPDSRAHPGLARSRPAPAGVATRAPVVLAGWTRATRASSSASTGAATAPRRSPRPPISGCPRRGPIDLLALLDSGGCLADGATDARSLAALDPADRARLAPDVAALSLLPPARSGGLTALRTSKRRLHRGPRRGAGRGRTDDPARGLGRRNGLGGR